MNRSEKILKRFLCEELEKWIDEVIKDHKGAKIGDKVQVIKEEFSPSLRKVYSMGGKFIASYDTRDPKETKQYRDRYKDSK